MADRLMVEQPLGEQPLVGSLAEKVMETIERTEHLVSLVPAHLLDWRPEVPSKAPEANDIGHLLGHLLDCVAGFCAALLRAFPVQLADFQGLRSITVNESCSSEEALKKIEGYRVQIQRGFQCCTDGDLSMRIQTVFVPNGETLLTILLGNLEHLINHKYQLFLHLKLVGLRVGSRDIYKWRGVLGQHAQATVEPE
jgi:DinB superfamily